MTKYASLVVALLLTTVAVGQTGENYTVTGSSAVTGNDNNCMSHNCFLPVAQYNGGSQAQLRDIESGQDGTVLSIGMSQDLWQLPLATPAAGKSIWQPWSPGSGQTWEGIAVQNQNEIYLLKYDTTCTPSGTSRMAFWNGSTLDYSSGLCANALSVTADDTLFGFWNTGGNDGFSYYAIDALMTYPNFNWVRVPGDGWTKIVGVSTALAYGIMNNTLYSINLTNNTYTAVPNTSPVKDLAVTGDQWLSVLTTTGTNNVYMMDLTAQTPTWQSMLGNLKNIYGGIHLSIFGTDGNFFPYHYLSHAVTSSVVVSGNYNCGIGGGGCPHGAFHTLKSTVQYPTGYFSGVASYGTLPQNQATVTASDVSGACDLFYGDPTSPECKPKISRGDVNCVVMGLILARALTLDFPHMGTAYGSGRITAVSRKPASKTGLWVYALVDNCNPGGLVSIGSTVPNTALDTVRTDTPALGVWAWCIWGAGWLTQCLPGPSFTFGPENISSRSDPIPQTHCTQHSQ